MHASSRREFLSAAASAAAFTAVAGQTLAAEPKRTTPRAPKKAVKIGMVAEGTTLLEKFEILRECGFDGVEMDSPNDLVAEDVLAAAAVCSPSSAFARLAARLVPAAS